MRLGMKSLARCVANLPLRSWERGQELNALTVIGAMRKTMNKIIAVLYAISCIVFAVTAILAFPIFVLLFIEGYIANMLKDYYGNSDPVHGQRGRRMPEGTFEGCETRQDHIH
jgi:hypothetical protein